MTAAVAVVVVKEGGEASHLDREDATVLPSASVVVIVVAVVGLPGVVVVVGDQATIGPPKSECNVNAKMWQWEKREKKKGG